MGKRVITAVAIVVLLAFALAGCADIQIDLMSNLPKTVGGETLVYAPMDPTEPNSWQAAVLAASGRDAADMTVVSGFTSPAVGYSSFAVQIKGMTGEHIVDLMLEAMAPGSSVLLPVSVEGKQLSCTGAPATETVNPDACVTFNYVVRDTVISMTGPAPQIQEAVRQLP